MTPRENEILRQENEALRHRLGEAEQVNEALAKGQIDAVVDAAHQAPLLLSQAQEALRGSEKRYRTLFDESPLPKWLVDQETFAITDVNEAAVHLYGYSREEFLSKTMSEIWHPDQAASAMERVAAAATEPWSGISRHVKKGGANLTVEVFSHPIQLAGRHYQLSVIRDITEHRQAEAEKTRLLAIIEESPDFIGVADLQGNLMYHNRAAKRMVGLPEDADLGHLKIGDMHPGRGAKLVVEEGIPTVLREGTWRRENVLLHRNGSEIPVSQVLVVHRNSTGEPEFISTIMRDITDLKRVEAQRERLAALVEASPDFIGFADPKTGQIQYINKHGRKMCGLGEDEDVGKLKIGDVHPAWMNKRLVEVVLPAAVRDGLWEGEAAFLHRNGREIPVLMALLAGKATNGEVELFYTVSRDITEMKRLEAQFLQSQKMEAVGRLAGGVAHDFNNLLTVIFGYSDVVFQGLGPGPLHEAMQEVRRASERAAALTRQLLAFSRKQTLVPEVLDMGDVVSGLSTMVERLIGEEIKVSVVVPANLGRVKADRGQLEQVVMNLAVNARDAMPKGGSLIFELQNVELDDADTVTHAEVKPGPYVLLAISDTGAGMDVETQNRIFEPFFTTKEAGKGTGLGLSTVHGIVHQSGGSISVYSEPGRGTTFKVYLPRYAGDAAVRRPVSGVRKAPPIGSETVLVVEDDAAIRQLTNLILQKAGYTVLLAESPAGAERIAVSHSGPIHLMLTDVVMPGMRGPELAERLLRLRPDLRVLYMSGYTDNAIAHHGFLDAGTEFLQKPFTPLGLMHKIREVLGPSES